MLDENGQNGVISIESSSTLTNISLKLTNSRGKKQHSPNSVVLNRGASGIDGIISAPTTLLIGNVAALHDMNAFQSFAFIVTAVRKEFNVVVHKEITSRLVVLIFLEKTTIHHRWEQL
eukprot:12175621-Ditylum_brightwellii.AAC.1